MSGVSRRGFVASTALAALFGAAGARRSLAAGPHGKGGSLPWRNWSGGQLCLPHDRFSPASEDELAAFMVSGRSPLRPVGAGHSFSALVPTDGDLIVLDQLTGLLGHDSATLRATVAGGSRLGDLGGPLEAAGQAMFVLPDIDRQTLAGATATATHGTGIAFTCLSGYVTALRLVTPAGHIMDLDPHHHPELFAAARVNLGALGVVTRLTLQNRTPYRLKAVNRVEPIEAVLERFDAAAASHRHFEMFPLTHSDYALTLAIDETDEPVRHPPPDADADAAFAEAIAAWAAVPPARRRPVMNAAAQRIEPTEEVDVSYRILTHVRNDRFNEMEYSVPLYAGADCLREVLRTISDKNIDVVFPLEYRYVRGDDTWLGMASGEDRAAISIHRMASADYRPYFDVIEPVFWKYGGRPHWGKVHSLDANRLKKLYPRFDDFQAVRRELDPRGRMLNDALRVLLVG